MEVDNTSLFTKIRGWFQNRSPTGTKFRMMQESNGAYIWNDNVYKSDVVTAAIRPYIKGIGKLVAKHLRDQIKPDGTHTLQINPEAYMRFLLEEPNPYMTGQKYQEALATQLILNGNAFALIARDDNGFPVGLYPINAVGVETKYLEDGSLYLQFMLANGKQYTFDYDDVVHLRGDYGAENDFFGASRVPKLLPLLEIVGTTDAGIVKAIKNSGIIRWLLKFANPLRPEDAKTKSAEFAENFLSAQSGTGVAAVGSNAEAIQIHPDDYVPNAAQMDRTTMRIYAQLNTNQKIVTSEYSEDEWNAYYEAQIEPDVRQFGDEHTRKLFSRRERGCGNRIVYEASNLATASMSTKLGLQAMVDRGAMLPNEWRKVLNLAPIPGGDVPVRRLDTAPVEGGGEKE